MAEDDGLAHAGGHLAQVAPRRHGADGVNALLLVGAQGNVLQCVPPCVTRVTIR